jgi:hypothetical protein
MDLTIAKEYKNINWKQCQLELFKLQSEILRAFRTGDTKNGTKSAAYFDAQFCD